MTQDLKRYLKVLEIRKYRQSLSASLDSSKLMYVDFKEKRLIIQEDIHPDLPPIYIDFWLRSTHVTQRRF